MIVALIPNKYQFEYKYVLRTLFNDFFANINLIFEQTNDIDLRLIIGDRIVLIPNQFFKLFEPGNYLSAPFPCPKNPKITLYGNEKPPMFNEKGELVVFQDIIANIFFCLTRWEELFDKDLDLSLIHI